MKFRTLTWMLAALPGSMLAQNSDYCLTVEAHAVDGIAGMTTYRFYVDAVNPTDFVGAVFGDATTPLHINTSTGFYNDDFGGSSSDDINPAIFAAMPSAEYDSWVTIGTESAPEPPNMSITTIESPTQSWISHFDAGTSTDGTDVSMDDGIGGIWFLMAGAANGLPDATSMRVLIMQMTIPSADDVWGTMNFQIFVESDPSNMITSTCSFNGPGTFCPGDQVAVSEVGASDWQAYPTVNAGQIQLTGWATACDLLLVDGSGRMVGFVPSQGGHQTVEFNNVPTGWYTLVATDGQRRDSRRLYISH